MLARRPVSVYSLGMTERTLVVSATNLLARGFLTVPTDRKSRAGAVVNGLYAVARSVLHVASWKEPARAVAIVDRKSREWPELLAPQLQLLPPLLRTLGLTVVEAEGEPHLVASYTRAAVARGDDVVIVGMDKRYAQLVTDTVWWYDANKDARYTPEIVKKRFGVGPHHVADWLALVGDDDQVPGVSGIGAKGATKLLEEHSDVEAALGKLDTLEGRVKKALEAARAELAEHLARTRLDGGRTLPLPLAECRYAPAPAAKLNAELEALGFVELLVSVDAATRVTSCATPEDFAAALAKLGGGTVSLDALLEDAEPGRETLHAIALSTGDGEAFYVLASSAAWPAVVRWLEDAGAPKAGHDLVATLVTLRRQGVQVAGVATDSACLSHLTQPSGWAPHELPRVARFALGRSLPDDDEVRGTGAERKAWSELPPEAAARTAAQRAEATAALVRALAPGVDGALLAEYLELEDTCVRMELTGIAIDAGQLDRAEVAFEAIGRELEAQIEALAGHAFNINSSAQLGKVLFEELKLPVVSHTKTGFSTANEALERIDAAHPIVGLVLRWRLLRRLRDNWVRALRRCIGPDGRVHSRFHPARSFSGELINTNPDLGRVPGRTPEMAQIRRAFVAPPGRLLMSVDFNQLGLHVLAHLTKDPALVEPLRQRADMHRLTAAAVLEKPADQITLDERQLGKVVNFATFAGQGASALGMQLGITPAEAKEYIARFDRHYAKVRAFQDEQLRLVKERGYLVTIAGRRWPIGGLESLDSQLRSYAERLARRGTHEGSVADVSRRALLHADRALKQSGLTAVPLLEIVDEVLFEVAEAELAGDGAGVRRGDALGVSARGAAGGRRRGGKDVGRPRAGEALRARTKAAPPSQAAGGRGQARTSARALRHEHHVGVARVAGLVGGADAVPAADTALELAVSVAGDVGGGERDLHPRAVFTRGALDAEAGLVVRVVAPDQPHRVRVRRHDGLELTGRGGRPRRHLGGGLRHVRPGRAADGVSRAHPVEVGGSRGEADVVVGDGAAQVVAGDDRHLLPLHHRGQAERRRRAPEAALDREPGLVVGVVGPQQVNRGRRQRARLEASGGWRQCRLLEGGRVEGVRPPRGPQRVERPDAVGVLDPQLEAHVVEAGGVGGGQHDALPLDRAGERQRAKLGHALQLEAQLVVRVVHPCEANRRGREVGRGEPARSLGECDDLGGGDLDDRGRVGEAVRVVRPHPVEVGGSRRQVVVVVGGDVLGDHADLQKRGGGLPALDHELTLVVGAVEPLQAHRAQCVERGREVGGSGRCGERPTPEHDGKE